MMGSPDSIPVLRPCTVCLVMALLLQLETKDKGKWVSVNIRGEPGTIMLR